MSSLVSVKITQVNQIAGSSTLAVTEVQSVKVGAVEPA